MPVTKSLLAPNKTSRWQVVILDARPPFYVTQNRKWQMLFGPETVFSASEQILKIGVEFDKDDFNSVRFAAYLYHPASGTVSSAGTCSFKVFKVTTPTWTEELVNTFNGVPTYNSYFFADVLSTSFPGVDFFGGDTIMVEATVTRLGETYRDRVYVNHLGIYDNVDRLRKDVQFLDITKLDE